MKRALSVPAITLVLALLVGGLLSTAAGGSTHPTGAGAPTLVEAATQAVPVAARGKGRPNIVLVLTDDMRADDLTWMPHTRRLVKRAGRTYVNAVSPHPLCCPARAEILSGQYAHNNGVRHNSGPHGGYRAFDPRNTVASWLRASGYVTGFIGKPMNGYLQRHGRDPGWTAWEPLVQGMATYTRFRFFGGELLRGSYVTDQIADRTVRMIRRFHRTGKPFLIMANHLAPHDRQTMRGSTNPVPAPRHRGRWPRATSPSLRSPAFNNDSDQPYSGHKYNPPRINAKHRARIRSLAAVDEAVLRIVKTLRRTGELSNTYLVFTSDNGYSMGEHRFIGKNVLTRQALRIPLLVRGPGIKAGSRSTRAASLVDLAPTFAAIARTRPKRAVDGTSIFRPSRRDTTLVQTGWNWSKTRRNQWRYRGVMTGRYLYARNVHHPNVAVLFDRARDPYELKNLVRSPRYAAVRRELERRYQVLKGCNGPRSCNKFFGKVPKPAPAARKTTPARPGPTSAQDALRQLDPALMDLLGLHGLDIGLLAQRLHLERG